MPQTMQSLNFTTILKKFQILLLQEQQAHFLEGVGESNGLNAVVGTIERKQGYLDFKNSNLDLSWFLPWHDNPFFDSDRKCLTLMPCYLTNLPTATQTNGLTSILDPSSSKGTRLLRDLLAYKNEAEFELRTLARLALKSQLSLSLSPPPKWIIMMT